MKRFSKYLSLKIEILLIPPHAIRAISEISEEVHHHDNILDFANAFVSPGGINIFARNGARCRWLIKAKFM
jgi:hypothetical protein